MNKLTFAKLWPHYKKAWPWLKETPSFVGKTERYETITSAREKRDAFWDSGFWAWLKANKMIESNKRCQRLIDNKRCTDRAYALHHRVKKDYYHPLPESLELVCSDCHDFSHFKGNHNLLKGNSMPVIPKDGSLRNNITNLYYKDTQVKSKILEWSRQKESGKRLLKDIAKDAKEFFIKNYPTTPFDGDWRSALGNIFTKLGLNESRQRRYHQPKPGRVAAKMSVVQCDSQPAQGKSQETQSKQGNSDLSFILSEAKSAKCRKVTVSPSGEIEIEL